MSISTHAARFTIGTREVSPSHSPYIIAEIGVNHDGSVARARELIHAAHAAGADAAKFQCLRCISVNAALKIRAHS
jgi:sialic acid synthase SpsE